MSRRTWLALAILWTIFVRTGFTQQTDSEHWYEFSIDGVRCGHLHRVLSSGEGVVCTKTEEQLRIRRNGIAVQMRTTRRFEETDDGVALEARCIQAGDGPTRSSILKFIDRTIVITTSRLDDEPTEIVRSDPGGWLTPRAVNRLVQDRIASGADRIEYQQLRLSGAPGTVQQITMQRRLVAPAAATRDGAGISCWEVHREGESLELLEWRDGQGLLLESELDTGLGPIRSALVNREQALSASEGPGPEVMRSTLIEVPLMPSTSDRVVTAGYHLRLEGPLGGFDTLPLVAGAQRVRRLGERLLECEVDASRGSPATPAELVDPLYRRPSRALDSADPAIIEFTSRALESAPEDPLERAERLRTSVDRHLHHKSLSSALASASEVVRTRSGDCTEHAMLLAAVFRADGIPSRVAIGLVHTELGGGGPPAFVWHMWTQGLVEGQWYDFDPTRRHRFDGGHVLVALDALSNDEAGPHLAALLGLVGRLRIQVVMIDGVAVEQPRESS